MEVNSISLPFQDMPNDYLLLKETIKDETLKNLYIKFNFKYISLKDQGKSIETLLCNYLNDYKFITFACSLLNKESKNIVNTIFCIEGQCLIIESIDKELLHNIISNIKSVCIDVSPSEINSTSLDMYIDEEISSFYYNFQREIKSNQFLKYTIRPIIAYIIRRNFYPSNFFSNPDFFEFHKKTKKSDKITTFNSEELIQKVNDDKLKMNETDQIEDFHKNDFIYLRHIFTNSFSLFTLVLHKKSFCIFLMKKFDSNDSFDLKCIKHEIDFCSKYSNQYFTHFYGFLKENDDIIGFIYDYMSNGNLENFISKHKNDVDDFFLHTVITRIVQAIRYLHSNSLIYRDLKPDNILINHDFIPFLSDFDTIREIKTESHSIHEEKTKGLGSIRYSSPEQYNGEDYSFPTDIYSFGLVTYFVFEKKYIFETDDTDKNMNFIKNGKLPEMKNTPIYIQDIIKQCIKYDQKDRISIELIEKNLFDEANKFEFLDLSFLKKQIFDKNKETQEIHQFFKEMYYLIFVLHNNTTEYLNDHQVQLFELLYLSTNSDIMNFLNEVGRIYFDGKLVETDYQKAKEYFLIPAEKGDSNAQLHLGLIYQSGDEKDFEKAREYYEKSASQNNYRAITCLGIIYSRGIGVEVDYEKAKNYFEIAAKQNNNVALLYLGMMYGDGRGVEQDKQKSIEYFELSAQQNNSSAIKCLVITFYENLHSLTDYAKAKKYFEIGAEKNDSLALCGLGKLYENGFGVQKDLHKAKEYYELSSQLNNSYGSRALGDLYKDGEGVKRDIQKAKELYELSIQQNENNEIAINRLGYIYFMGDGAIKQDLEKAKELFEIAAEKNDPEALNNLGVMYYSGQGVEKDYLKAKEYFELSAEQNDSNGLNNLGVLYLHGYGVNRDYDKAKECFELAVKQGDSNAQINLGSMYKNAQGTAQDFNKAKKYYELAAKQNNSIAFYKIGKLYYYGHGVEKDYKQAVKYFEIAAKEQYHKAYYILGMIYKNGYTGSIERNYQKSKKYFELAATLGNSDALYQIGSFYFYGYISDVDYKKAKEYFEMSAQKQNLNSLYYLGLLYEKGCGVERNIQKAIDYYLKCASNKKDKYIVRTKNEVFSIEKKFILNNFYYRSNNDLGLIFLTEKSFQNIELGEKYIKEAGLNEYPFGQNNFGLFNQYYLNHIGNAEYMYEKSLKSRFALAEFNLGKLNEEANKIKDSIEHYIKASDYENEQIVFRNQIIDDERLNISKTFVICFTNLKLADYYHSIESVKISNEKIKIFYYLKAIFCPLFNLLFQSSKKSFSFIFNTNKINDHLIITNLKELVLNNPLFHSKNDIKKGWTIQEENENQIKLNLTIDQNQSINSFDLSIKKKIDSDEKEKKEKMNEIYSKFNESIIDDSANFDEYESKLFNIFEFLNKQNQFELIKNTEQTIHDSQISNNNHFIRFKFKEDNRERFLIYPKLLFKILINTINENENMIKEIVDEMSAMLFTSPYSILFGRIKIYEEKEDVNQNNKQIPNINEDFYDGIGSIF